MHAGGAKYSLGLICVGGGLHPRRVQVGLSNIILLNRSLVVDFSILVPPSLEVTVGRRDAVSSDGVAGDSSRY